MIWKPLLVARLMGGLGNQLFQYAAARAIALRGDAPLWLDVSWYRRNPVRDYRLDRFRIAARPMPQPAVRCLVREPSTTLRGKMLNRACDLLRLPSLPVLTQEEVGYDEAALRQVRSAYLVGYWQSEWYFRDVEDVIRSELRMRDEPDSVNERVAESIDRSESVSLHVRRGDYVSDPAVRRFHGTCGLDYYRRAGDCIAMRMCDPHFYVFSDDVPWVRKHLRLDYPVTFVDHNGADRDYEDLRLMSLCKHHIIANSSFSWWGAWLAQNEDKIVIAPERWFRDPRMDASDLIPEDWLRL